MKPKFGPNEQTREQRLALFTQAAAINATQERFMEPFAVELCQKYIAGEWTIQQVMAEVKRVYQARNPAYQPGPEVPVPAFLTAVPVPA